MADARDDYSKFIDSLNREWQANIKTIEQDIIRQIEERRRRMIEAAREADRRWKDFLQRWDAWAQRRDAWNRWIAGGQQGPRPPDPGPEPTS